MQNYHAYRQNAASGWTRIDMLLAIYDGAVESLDGAIDALNRNDRRDFARWQLRANQLVLALLDGIDTDSSQTASRIRDLCIYCVEQISTPTVRNFEHASEILSTLRTGFRNIRDEAVQLEASGVIPSLSATRVSVLHV